MKNANELREERAALVKKMRDLLDENPKGLSDEQEAKYDSMEKDADKLLKNAKRLESLEREESDLKASMRRGAEDALEPQRLSDEDAAKAKRKLQVSAMFDAGGYMRAGRRGMTDQFRNALEEGTDSEGGYLVPQEWASEIVAEQAEITVVRRYADSIQTSSDRNIPVETTRGDFAWIDEEGAYGEDDPAFGNEVLGAWKVGGIVKVSEELLQDNAFNLQGFLRRRAAVKFADAEEDAFINGNGTLKPTGLQQLSSVAGVSITGTTAASTTAVTADELIDTYHGLSRRYRMRAVWIASDTLAKNVRKLKDSDNQYLWQPGLRDGEPDTLLGRPFEVSDSMAVPAASVKSLLFGDLGYYLIGDRLGISVQRLDELYAANGQVGFRFRKRVDGKLTLAPALTFLQQAAS